MPIYEYQCEKCKRTFEYMQSMSDAPKKKCERCGGKLGKLVSAAGFVLKGGGWYKDLYASSKPDSGGADDGDSKADDSKPEKTEDKKTEVKPEKAKPAEVATKAKPKAKKAAGKK